MNSVDCAKLSVLDYYMRKEWENYHSLKDSKGVSITDPAQMKTNCFDLSFLIGMEAVGEEASSRLITA